MADFLNLAYSDYTDVASKQDLLRGRWKLRMGAWEPTAFPGAGKRAQEVLRLRATGTMAQVAAAERTIQGMLEQARRWQEDPRTHDGVWLEWSVDGEPGAGTYAAKRSFLYDGVLRNASNGRGAFARADVFGTLALTRHSCWENETYETIGKEGVSLLGGTADISVESAYAGNEPGRIQVLSLTAGPGQRRTWAGIRPYYEGISSFVALWELESGTNGTDTSDVVDATASAGNKIQTTFATVATMAERVQILVDNILGANYEHMMGTYQVLLRAKAGAASNTFYVRMRSGFDGCAQVAQGSYVQITSTDWHLYELGQVAFPPIYRYEGSLGMHHCGIWLDAERVAGAGNLDMDCLVLIPTFASVMADNQNFSGVANTTVQWITLPDDSQFVREFTTDYALPDPAFSAFSMPRTPGVLVIAGERTTGQVLTDTVTIGLDWYPRWRLYRGATGGV